MPPAYVVAMRAVTGKLERVAGAPSSTADVHGQTDEHVVQRLVELLLSTPLDWAKDESIASALKEPVRPFQTFKCVLNSPAQVRFCS
jgi:hypothetical protein